MKELEKKLSLAPQKKRDYFLPASIVLGAILIGGFMYLSPQGQDTRVENTPPEDAKALAETAKSVQPINEEDHVRGNPIAPIAIIEFSDFQCPFCKKFHPVMLEILKTYPDKVRWVYRHFPLEQIHPHAQSAALASECIAELGGNEAFWHFADSIFENQEIIGPELYKKIATELDINPASFNTCIDTEKYAEKVRAQSSNAQTSGAQGTPYSIIVAPNGEISVISGALPFESIQNTIKKLL